MVTTTQTLEKVFREAVKYVESSFGDQNVVFSNLDKLHFYALYKLATEGHCT